MLALPLHVVPLQFVQYFCDGAMRALNERHRPLFERLTEISGARILVDTVDLPIVFVLTLDPHQPMLKALARGPSPAADAAIRAPLAVLIDLMEGRIDGDALFFTRDVTISGDTQIVLALRNAVDGAGIDLLTDLAVLLGPLAGPGEHLMRATAPAAGRVLREIGAIWSRVLAPLTRDIERQGAALVDLQGRLAMLEKRASRLHRAVQ